MLPVSNVDTGKKEIAICDSLHKLLEDLGGERRINYSLDRFREALKRVGNPERTVHTLIVSGTNGKGTTSLLISSALMHAGCKVGTFLSPHLQNPRERFLYNLEQISEEELTALAQEFQPVAKRYELTYFEYLSLLNFIRAQREAVDFLVLEVGLGGRLDATNVTQPLGCVLTNISRDHEEYLGHTLEEILEEKLGVVPREGLLFTGIRSPNLLARVEKKCEELDAVYYYAEEVPALQSEVTWSGQKITLSGFPFELSNPSTGTVENAALALLLLRIMFPRIAISTIQKAFKAVKTPGRMEVVASNPRVVLSGDHNPGGITSLMQTLEKLKPESLKILCAFSPDKPYAEMFESLSSICDEIVLTEIPRYRGKMPENYYRMGPFLSDPNRALDSLLQSSNGKDTLLITGSLYLVGALRNQWLPQVAFVEKGLPHQD